MLKLSALENNQPMALESGALPTMIALLPLLLNAKCHSLLLSKFVAASERPTLLNKLAER